MKITPHFARLAAIVSLFVAITGVAQEKAMYQWTDENGVVHFSDTAPEGLDVQPQAIPNADPPSTDNPYRQAEEADEGEEAGVAPAASIADQKREEIAARASEAKAEKAAMAVECANWKQEVEQLEPNRRVYFTNDQGETERMDDVVRTDRVAELKALIAKNCQ